MAGVVHVPWYATGLRGDKLAAALAEISAVALRYGATEYLVYRSREDRYRFIQLATFDDKLDFERYWYSEEIADLRAQASGLYQVPVLPMTFRVVDAGELVEVPDAGA